MGESQIVLRTEPGQPVLKQFRSSDGYDWYYRHYQAAGTPHSYLVVIHGIQSHGGWYTRSCAEFAKAGHDVYFLDRRGAGLNRHQRGDLPGFRRVLDDYAEFLLALPQNNVPRYLAAISWGGKLGLALPYRHPGLIQGLALLCPGFFSIVQPKLVTRARIAFSRIFWPTRSFPIPLNDPQLFTGDPAAARFIHEEPLGLRSASARMLFSSFALDIYLRRASKHARIPLLLLLAGREKIINNERTRAFFASLPASRKEVIYYTDAHHTLEFEGPQHPFTKDILKWFGQLNQNIK